MSILISLGHTRSTYQISSQSVDNFLSYVDDMYIFSYIYDYTLEIQ